MPLTAKGKKILAAMRKEYGEKRGTSVFYASKNAGKINGVDAVLFRAAMADAKRQGLTADAAIRQALDTAMPARTTRTEFRDHLGQALDNGMAVSDAIWQALMMR